MTELALTFHQGHLFVELNGNPWLLDTGAPESFGIDRGLEVAGHTFDIASSYMGLDASQLSDFVGTACQGLLGADVINTFDWQFDAPAGRTTVSREELDPQGTLVDLDFFMGIPIVEVQCLGRSFRFFFDTGAQISYLQDDVLSEFPARGNMTDFYPGFGEFEAPTFDTTLELAGVVLQQRCGRLPESLGMSLTMADVEGILGNTVVKERAVGYFPRRNQLRL
jgi:hypothetical protein